MLARACRGARSSEHRGAQDRRPTTRPHIGAQSRAPSTPGPGAEIDQWHAVFSSLSRSATVRKKFGRVGRPVLLVKFGCGGEAAHAPSLVRWASRRYVHADHIHAPFAFVSVHLPCSHATSMRAIHDPVHRAARRIAEGFCEGAVPPATLMRSATVMTPDFLWSFPRRCFQDVKSLADPGANPWRILDAQKELFSAQRFEDHPLAPDLSFMTLPHLRDGARDRREARATRHRAVPFQGRQAFR